MMEKPLDDVLLIKENLKRIKNNITEACIAAGRQPNEVTLMGVTKTVSAKRINDAIGLGLSHIGENRVQEYLGKKDELNLNDVKVHFIGHLQTNKVSRIVSQVDMIDSIDSLRLANTVNKASLKAGRVTDVLIEVNIGREIQKSGILEENLEEFLYQVSTLNGLRVVGLMTVPPILTTERQRREVFSRMFKLFIDIKGKNIDNIFMDILSMGMSSDYVEAIMEGATMVRVGSALFGKRL
ncbi:MAG: YggS family pyridoxal phosphate-dependent enzyme [Oscillospiraceae bacterium]|nr:YggS family pyridoxal phosphate-dependent enzyme [Oscillospiraceae bacterium]